MAITLKTAQSEVTIVQIYAPTYDKNEELEQFYNELEQPLNTTKPRDVPTIMGSECKIGKGSEENFIGNFGF